MSKLRPGYIDFEASWLKLSDCLATLLAIDDNMQKINKEEWLQMFIDVYSICISSQENMYEKLYYKVDKFLAMHVTSIAKALEAIPNDSLLLAYRTEWNHFQKGMDLIDKVFSHVNRQYVNNPISRERIRAACHPSFVEFEFLTDRSVWLSISELALVHWRDLVISKLKDNLVEISLFVIEKDRFEPNSTAQDICDSVKCVCTSLSLLATLQTPRTVEEKTLNYAELFESPLLKSTSKYYKEISQGEFLDDAESVVQYMHKVIQLIEEETKRVETFITRGSYKVVINECRECLLEDHILTLDSYTKLFMNDNNIEAISNLYKLLNPLQAIRQLISKFSEYVEEKSIEQLKSTNPKKFVLSFLQIHKIFHDLIKRAMDADKLFFKAFDESIFKVINRRLDNKKESCALMLSCYLDMIIKQKDGEAKDIKDAMLIFGYLSDKDMFYNFYSRQLALRLVYRGFSADRTLEEQVITELKQSCNLDFLVKLQKMLTDFSLSNQLNREFLSGARLPIEFSTQIYQTGSWPLLSSNDSEFTSVKIPERETISKDFEEFYTKKYNGRKLRWLDNLSTVEIRLNFAEKPYIFILTIHQYNILNCFEHKNEINMEELSVKSGLNNSVEFRNALTPLLDCEVLKITRDNNEMVQINLSFNSQRIKHYLHTYACSPKAHEELANKKIEKSLDLDRDHFIQALIVRILKSTKTIKHTMLIKEVINGAKDRFAPSIPIIKRAIEALVERQFIQRTDGSPDEYTYVA